MEYIKILALALAIAEGKFIISELEDDGYLNTLQLANKFGYSCEEHFATTDDGYILGLHRITGRLGGPKVQNSAPTVFIIIIIMGWLIGHLGPYHSSGLKNFLGFPVILGSPDQERVQAVEFRIECRSGTNSLAGILSDNGLDVWLGNIRGNRYSRNHTTLDPNKTEFWKHTYNEIALKDYPTMVDYILSVVGKDSLHFVGYSQGGLLSAAFLGMKVEYNAKIKSVTLLASAYKGRENFESVRSKLMNAQLLKSLPESYNENIVSNPTESRPYSHDSVRLAYKYCHKGAPSNAACLMIAEDLFGKDEGRISPAMFTYFFAHMSCGQTSNIMLHLSQIVKTGNASLFDYGSKNQQIYNQATPPIVNLANITPPKLMFYGTNDHFFSEYEVTKTASLYTNANVVRVEGFNHLNFMLARDLKTKVVDRLIQYVQNNN